MPSKRSITRSSNRRPTPVTGPARRDTEPTTRPRSDQPAPARRKTMATETRTAPTPAFVAPEIDIIDPGVYERGGIPHRQFAWLRDNDPVHWHADPNDGVDGF